jgi:hypothetical protein
MKYCKKIKYNRVSFYFIHALIGDKSIRIGKDFGSMGRSKPLYFVELNGEILQHGFDTQKEAKYYVINEVLNETN